MLERTDDASHAANGRHAGTGVFEHALNALTQAIRDGVYRAGDRLVESRLARELGISRSTLREVLRRLNSEGLIRLQPNRGAIVRSFSRRDVSELLQVRELLEGFAASLAANYAAAPERRQRIQERLDHISALRAAAQNIDYSRDNSSFHEFVIELSENRMLAQQIRQLQFPHLRTWYFDQLKPAEWERSLNEHEQILLAILDGDSVLAGHLMSAHIRRTRKLFENLPDEAPTPM